MSPAAHPFAPPSPWVARFAPLVRSRGPALDLACGSGRHGRLLLDGGHPVTLVDRDLRGVADLAGRPDATLLEADLEQGRWPVPGRFAAIVVTNYLHRPLFGPLVEALEPDGVLIYETFAAGNERFGRPASPDFLLQPGELLQVAAGLLTVVAFEQGEVASPRAAVIQRLCAVNRPGGPLPPLPAA